MSGGLRIFGFEIDVHGARVVLEREPLCSGRMNDAQVAYDIDLLKKNLDRVGDEMKKALHEQRTKPDFQRVPILKNRRGHESFDGLGKPAIAGHRTLNSNS